MNKNQEHWERIYATKSPNEVSWTQVEPTFSLEQIKKHCKSKEDQIIDIGGGDSNLSHILLNDGYLHLTVLDISKNAIERSKKTLGDQSSRISWIHSDILQFKPSKKYDIWHDRATFHFLLTEQDINSYVTAVNNSGAHIVIIGGFAEDGPLKCSGLDVNQLSREKLQTYFKAYYTLIEYYPDMSHITPFNTEQKFSFAVLIRN